MSLKDELGDKFLLQDFTGDDHISQYIDRYKAVAAGYAQTENAIAVLSDLKEHCSYIYYGGMAQTLGMCEKGTYRLVHSIWEEDVFEHIVPEYSDKRHCDELKFISFLRNNLGRNSDYYLKSFIRMVGMDGSGYGVCHRIFYVVTQKRRNIRLALCLYNLTGEAEFDSRVCNSASGEVFLLNQHEYGDIISEREKEVLRLIDKGKLSKEISEMLFISVNTVNRHRQNILSKLQASNSVDACRIAKQLKLI